MRIAYDSAIFTSQQYGGISRYFCSLVKALSVFPQIEPKIFAPLHINNYLTELPPRTVFGNKVPTFPKCGFFLRTTNAILMKPCLDKFSPNILHETYYALDVYAPPKTTRIVTVYDMIHERIPSSFSVKDTSASDKRIVTGKADHIICISNNTARDYKEIYNVSDQQVSVVHLGFDRLTSSESYKNDKIKPFLLYVGSRNGYKNFKAFLVAYATSSWLKSNFDVVCFGGGPFTYTENQLFSVLGITNNQIIQQSGDDNSLANKYMNAELFVYPSLYEGFGIPPLEAMSLGCPVACSNTSSIPEVVGNAGEYFDPYNVDSIINALEFVLGSKERQLQLITFGLMRSAEFSWERCAVETLNIYKKYI